MPQTFQSTMPLPVMAVERGISDKLMKEGKHNLFYSPKSSPIVTTFGSKRENWCVYHFLPFRAKAVGKSFRKSHIKRNPATPIPRNTDAQSVYHLERKVGVAAESDAKRALLAKCSKAMKCIGMVEQSNPKKKISTYYMSNFWLNDWEEECCTHRCSGVLLAIISSEH